LRGDWFESHCFASQPLFQLKRVAPSTRKASSIYGLPVSSRRRQFSRFPEIFAGHIFRSAQPPEENSRYGKAPGEDAIELREPRLSVPTEHSAFAKVPSATAPAHLRKILPPTTPASVLQAIFVTAFKERFSLGALVAFRVTVADAPLLNVGTAFWGLVFDIAVSWLLEWAGFAANPRS